MSPNRERPDQDEPVADADAAETDDDSTHTRVFTADESVPDDAGVATQLASESDDGGDSYLDDTDVFSPDRGSETSGECRACGNELPGDSSVTFCPNCGQKI